MSGGVLVSLWRSDGPGLGVLDAGSLRFRELDLPGRLPALGISGLAAAGDRVYAVQHGLLDGPARRPTNRNALLILDAETLQVVACHTLALGRDVHSIAVADDTVFAVSTGTDEVLALRLGGDRVRDEHVFWRPDPSLDRSDHHHLNGILAHGGELLVSGFGRKAQVERWSSARDGFIVSIGSGRTLVRGIYQPHSVTALEDGLGYCESPLAAARLPAGRSVEGLPGYARGMCAVDGRLLVGTSAARSAGEPAGGAAVVRLDPHALAVEDRARLGRPGAEIYDLLAWPEAA